MKKTIHFLLCFIILVLAGISYSIAQSTLADTNQSNKGWTSNNPFKTDVFIENHGQFDSWAKSTLSIKYVINNSDKIFFTNQSVIFRLEKQDEFSEEEREKQERIEEKQEARKREIYYVEMNWEGSNPNTVIEVTDPTENYYTFGEKGYENLKAKGFKKLMYKNLYPNIDVEYIIPDKGGIKYSIILHPNADASLIKMHYSGDIEKINKDNNGNIVIKTDAGNITDHAPDSYYKSNNAKLQSSFLLKGNLVAFQLPTVNSQTIVIDPWTTTPTSLDSTNVAMDIAFDNFGNVFVSGGSMPQKLSKYSNYGILLWTFSTIGYWYNFYSKFCILPNSGTSFIGKAFAGANSFGCPVLKINNDGTYNYLSTYFAYNNEIWEMYYNNCSEQLIAFGGGTDNRDNIKIIADTNLSGSISKNFNGVPNNYGTNDMISVIMENNGDFYAIMPDMLNQYSRLQKSLYSSNYNPPCAFNVKTPYVFGECTQIQGVPYGLATVRANALALNSNYLFSYDGRNLIAWNKLNGSLIDSIIVDNNYTGGAFRFHEGIDVDECNNVYVGGSNKIHVFNFNGSSFIILNSMTSNIPNEVHGIKLNRKNGKLYVCGNGFVTETIASVSCLLPTISTTVTISVDSCKGNACVVPIGGLPPYTYLWSNGSTDSCILGVPTGIYTVIITDKSCDLNRHIDTVFINSYIQVVTSPSTASICSGDSIIITASANTTGITYQWNNASIGNSITVSPHLTTVYIVTASKNSCSSSCPVLISVNPSYHSLLFPVICQGESYSIGTHVYSTTGIYTDSLSTISGCDSIMRLNLTVNPSPNVNLDNDVTLCHGTSLVLNATYPNATYQWQDASTNPTFTVTEQGLYWVKASIDSCIRIDSVNVIIGDCEIILILPNIITPNGDGLNDIFQPTKIKNIIKLHTQIYNRWGNLVYETDKLNIEWDGKYKGQTVGDGVYYYIVNSTDMNGKESMLKGSLTVMR